MPSLSTYCRSALCLAHFGRESLSIWAANSWSIREAAAGRNDSAASDDLVEDASGVATLHTRMELCSRIEHVC